MFLLFARCSMIYRNTISNYEIQLGLFVPCLALFTLFLTSSLATHSPLNKKIWGPASTPITTRLHSHVLLHVMIRLWNSPLQATHHLFLYQTAPLPRLPLYLTHLHLRFSVAIRRVQVLFLCATLRGNILFFSSSSKATYSCPLFSSTQRLSSLIVPS